VNQTKTTLFLAKCALIFASICCATHSHEIHSSGLKKKLTVRIDPQSKKVEKKAESHKSPLLEGKEDEWAELKKWQEKNKSRKKGKTSYIPPESYREQKRREQSTKEFREHFCK